MTCLAFKTSKDLMVDMLLFGSDNKGGKITGKGQVSKGKMTFEDVF